MSTLTVPQQAFSPLKRKEEPVTSDFVEQKVFLSEMKRVDSEILNIKRTEEKQDKTALEAIKSLREDMKELRNDMNRRFEHLGGEIHSNFRWLVGMYLTGLGATLAAFYAFASYIKG